MSRGCPAAALALLFCLTWPAGAEPSATVCKRYHTLLAELEKEHRQIPVTSGVNKDGHGFLVMADDIEGDFSVVLHDSVDGCVVDTGTDWQDLRVWRPVPADPGAPADAR